MVSTHFVSGIAAVKESSEARRTLRQLSAQGQLSAQDRATEDPWNHKFQPRFAQTKRILHECLSARSCSGLPSSMLCHMLGQPSKSYCLHPWQQDLANVACSSLGLCLNINYLQLCCDPGNQPTPPEPRKNLSRSHVTKKWLWGRPRSHPLVTLELLWFSRGWGVLAGSQDRNIIAISWKPAWQSFGSSSNNINETLSRPFRHQS